jgi:2'-5' RNA ligase
MSRYVVVAPLTSMVVGDRFITREWPLHVTLVQVFATGATPAEIGRCLAEVADGAPAITVVAGDDEDFGPSRSIPVTVIEPSPALDALHSGCLAALETFAPVYENPEYMAAGYRPHVTVKRHGRVTAGDVVELRQIALVDMEPGQRDGGREVLAVAVLGGSTTPAHQPG